MSEGKQHKLREWMDKLKAENKALKESEKRIVRASKYVLEQFKVLKESRNELLKAIINHDNICPNDEILEASIQRAEAQKEKEE